MRLFMVSPFGMEMVVGADTNLARLSALAARFAADDAAIIAQRHLGRRLGYYSLRAPNGVELDRF